MSEYTKSITPEMVQTVDKLKATNFENATPEEIEIYAEWTKLMGLSHAAFEEKRQLYAAEFEARIQQNEREHEAAMNALTALTDLAKAKLRSVQNGA